MKGTITYMIDVERAEQCELQISVAQVHSHVMNAFEL